MGCSEGEVSATGPPMILVALVISAERLILRVFLFVPSKFRMF
jgi:hypothetical protein